MKNVLLRLQKRHSGPLHLPKHSARTAPNWSTFSMRRSVRPSDSPTPSLAEVVKHRKPHRSLDRRLVSHIGKPVALVEDVSRYPWCSRSGMCSTPGTPRHGRRIRVGMETRCTRNSMRARSGATGIDWTISKSTALLSTPLIGLLIVIATVALTDSPTEEQLHCWALE
jgi:hypothetical protein